MSKVKLNQNVRKLIHQIKELKLLVSNLRLPFGGSVQTSRQAEKPKAERREGRFFC